MYIQEFHSIRPQFETPQEESLEWLVEAHVAAERGDESFREEMKEKISRYSCKSDKIEKRGHVSSDFLHKNWAQMEIFKLHEKPQGVLLDTRLKVFCQHADRIFEKFYNGIHTAPDDIIHVTCTGYSSPSAAQKLVSKKNWGEHTTVTHAYHMGCYGSIPALRMAKGFLASEQEKNVAHVVHTEICSLHANPSLHRIDQLVSQSLFADGFIKYSVAKKGKGLAFHLIKTREEIIPNSGFAMTWDVVDWGFEMTLSKELPVLIARYLQEFMERLVDEKIWKKAYFAIHPGGPKILEHVQKILGLTDDQLSYSYQVLKEFGNISSATLPHIWQKIQADAEEKTHVISLAFGPGLTICGSVMELKWLG